MSVAVYRILFVCFFFNDTATTEIYTLSLHDALPILRRHPLLRAGLHFHDLARPCDRRRERARPPAHGAARRAQLEVDRKSTRLNSSHANISYAVFCLKKKKNRYRSIT